MKRMGRYIKLKMKRTDGDDLRGQALRSPYTVVLSL